MNLLKRHWRRVYIGFLAFLLFYAAEAILPLMMGIDVSQADAVSGALLILIRLTQIVTVALASLWHFAGSKVVASVKEGLWFGISYEIVGLIIDLLAAAISSAFPNVPASFRANYGTAFFVVSIVVALGIPMLIGKLKSVRT